MSATFAGKTDTDTPKTTAETAEEAMMETDNVTIETEQPRLAESPSPVEAGSDQQESNVKVTGVKGAAELPLNLAAEKGGSVLEKAPLGDLTPSKESVSNSNSSESEDKSSDKNKDDEMKRVASGGEELAEVISDEPVDFEKLSNLAKQIDDFDPCALLNAPSELAVDKENTADPLSSESVTFSRDLNDEKLIDELIEEAVDESKEDIDKGQVNSGDDSEREVTPDDKGSSNDFNGVSELANDVTLSNVKDIENGEEKTSNGSLSASTESEGFQEEQEEKPAEEIDSKAEDKQGKVEVKTTADKPKGNKVETQKTENSSPTKTAKSKKKEDKSIEHILKALSSLQTTEEKLAALCKKYADLHEDHRIVQSSFKQSQRKLTVISREKDQLQTEHTKAVMAKSKLESLCRELQKHNQTIRQESLQRAKEEDEKRKEISQKFQTTIGEIQTQMQENHERNKQLREENFELANKLKKFIEQYEAREKQVERVIKHRELEQKLADAKLDQASAILTEEKARGQKEREMLVIQTTEFMKKIQLKDAELTMYKERYDEFQSTIKKSEDMFSKFKTEMDKMTKRCKKLEKDGLQWKSKWENANRAILEMADEKSKYDKERGLLMTKVSKLESLCRAMQAERTARKMLETEGVDISKLSLTDSLPPNLEPSHSEPSPSPASPTPDDNEDTTCEAAENTSEDGSDNSSASEQTGVTVIQHDVPPADTSQSECKDNEVNQSETPSPEVINTDQSGTNSDSSNQPEIDQSNDAS